MDEWRKGLAGVTGEQIRHGLASWDAAWPPTLPEFRRACLGIADDWQQRGGAYRRFPPALPKPKANAEIVEAEIAKMRETMRR